ncbi:MAG: DUF1343 domain-containing protein [Cyclobacteriaceae bacterium]|nr:DUF1343 domain-containing protein [Cyclobacteriaceae bacterium HetDA_MAG_MS6]
MQSPKQVETILVKTGIDVLEARGFDILRGKKIGLITNPTGVNVDLKSTIDILNESSVVDLVALYGPEHGVRGNFSAGDHIDSETDAKTGLPVFSLYGKNRKPSQEMLQGVEVLVYDIQDIGVRSYTYISTMGLVMEAAAEAGIKFVVLDRPNPLGGLKVEGPLVTDGYFSFVSAFAIPYVYGLTPGELATFLNQERLLTDSVKCDLEVVSMENWKRSMTFVETGLPWVPPSPHIPKANSSAYYAMAGIIGELDPCMIGVGYTLPFEVFALPWIDADRLLEEMENLSLPGVRFRPIHFKPTYMKNKGKEYHGVQVYFTDFLEAPLTEIQFRFLEIAYQLRPDSSVLEINNYRFDMLDKVIGNADIRETFVKAYKFEDIQEQWQGDVEGFKVRSKPYHLYR